MTKPFFRGFYCSDETIRYPNNPERISTENIYIVGFSIIIILVLLFEYFRIRYSEQKKSIVYLKNTYCWLISFFFGSVIQDLITVLAKIQAGRMRPYFLEICQPKVYIETGALLHYQDFCQSALDKLAYVTDFECLGKDDYEHRDARMSFISGHSSHAAYTATFAIVGICTILLFF